MSWYPQPPMIGFEDMEADGQELAPITITWKNGEVIGGILGPTFSPEQWATQNAERLAEEAEEARLEELRTLYSNVTVLDDWRQR